jgi:TRAP-type mannitol/chloroaromatic compound transport system permease small subunit
MTDKKEQHDLTDEMLANARAHPDAGPLTDMPKWQSRTILVIDTFALWIGRGVAWMAIPLTFAMIYEVFARYFFTAPTMWAYDISRMLYGAMFVLGAAYVLSRGLHIRSDFLYRRWSVHTQGWVDTALYVTCFFPAMVILFWVSSEWAWASLSRGERGTDTAFMPLLGPVKSTLPVGVAFLIIQGVSELLKSLHAARKGRWVA